jgi:hypothetical protein
MVLLLAFSLMCSLGVEPVAIETTEPFAGVRYAAYEETTPRPLKYHVVEIDLAQPGLRFFTTPGNGDAPKDTDTQTTLEFVRSQGAQVGVNANYFVMKEEAQTDLLGLAVSNGAVVSPWDISGSRFGINFSAKNAVTFLTRTKERGTAPDVPLYNALAGQHQIIANGKITHPVDKKRHPRTIIALTRRNTLLLLVADGRQPGVSEGLTLHESAQRLFSLGAVAALALDGGGSSTLVFADPEPRVMNVPMPVETAVSGLLGPPGIQRANGNNLAIFAPPRKLLKGTAP